MLSSVLVGGLKYIGGPDDEGWAFELVGLDDVVDGQVLAERFVGGGAYPDDGAGEGFVGLGEGDVFSSFVLAVGRLRPVERFQFFVVHGGDSDFCWVFP